MPPDQKNAPDSRKQTFHQIIRMVSRGQVAQAERRCRSELSQHPDDINLNGLLGAVLLKAGRLEQAEVALRRTIKLAPAFAKPHEDLGIALLTMNRPAEAVDILRLATELDPSLELAHFNLGKALVQIGEGKAADRAFEASFDLNPERRALAEAAEHHRAGRLKEAETVYRQVIRRRPKNVDAIRLLGMVAYQSGEIEEAERLLRRAIRVAPDFVGAMIDLGRILNEQTRFEDAIEQYEKAEALEPNNAQIPFLRAASLAPAARTYDAIDAYERALQIRPDHAGALLGLGHTLKTVGRQDEAIAAYRACLDARPDNGEIYWSLANLKTYQFDDADIAAMKSSIESGGLSAQSEVNMRFSLGMAYDEREDYEQAWEYYQSGNAKQRMRESYDPVQNEVINDRLLDVFSAKFMNEKAGLGLSDPSPIFVMGLPRSGSTLLEQILASHSQVEGTSELPYLGRTATSLNRDRADGVSYPEAMLDLQESQLKALGRRYLELAQPHRTEGLPRFIDKMPNNYPNAGFARLILPNARIIDARRNPLDACLGCYRQLFAKGQTFTYDLTDIGEYYRQYQRLMDHWAEVMPGAVLTVQYEDLVSDPEPQIRRLIEFCGLSWEPACLKFYETDRPVRTASSEQVRQPIYTRSVNHWRHYQPYLGELIEVLEDVLPRYAQYTGYLA